MPRRFHRSVRDNPADRGLRGGTLFLDEIGTWPLGSGQAASLIQDREYERSGSQAAPADVRVIAATNRYRKRVTKPFQGRSLLPSQRDQLHLAPLRERPEDILPLALDFLVISAYQPQIDPRFQ